MKDLSLSVNNWISKHLSILREDQKVNQPKETMIIKYRWKVYSDSEIRSPDAYFNGIFPPHQSHLWNIIDVNGSCLTVETRSSYTVTQDTLESVFDSITPDLYQSSKRSYVKV